MANKKRMNIVYGEKYGDVNDPKTSWKRAGTLFIDEETGQMSIKLDMIPVSKHFDGWLAVFEQKEDTAYASSSDQLDGGKTPDPKAKKPSDEPALGDEPINLDDIPF
jgi:hypothetical protein